MKILVKTDNNLENVTLLKVSNEKIITKIKMLINKRRHKDAIEEVFTKGQKIKEVSKEYLGLIDADLILTENTVHYDLM